MAVNAMSVLGTSGARLIVAGLTPLEIGSGVDELSLGVSKLPLSALQSLPSFIQCRVCSLQDGHSLLSIPTFGGYKWQTSQRGVPESLGSGSCMRPAFCMMTMHPLLP